ncbi:MAG: sigma 54-interacting transcriptional regulator [Solidesulfovibrio sp.]
MDVTSFAVLRRVLSCLALAPDTGRGLDALLSRLLEAISDLPGIAYAAVVLTDADDQPAIRASFGAPDMGLILSATLDRGLEAKNARVLRRGAAPVPCGPDGALDLPRREAAMLAAPIAARETLLGWFCVNALLGPDAPLTEDLRLAILLADVVAGLAATAEQNAVSRLEMTREVAFLRSKVSLRYRHIFSDNQSTVLSTLRGEVDKAAQSDTPVLILGETGSGRSVLARLIHELSPRAVRPFATLNADEGEQLARRIFGGSGSLGAQGGPGLLEEADGGTLFIEQAHLLPPDVSERLARYLKTGVFLRLGSSRERTCATRLVFNAPPQGISPDLVAVAKPQIIRVPGLRQHREDIPALLAHFLNMEATRGGRRLTLTSKALKALEGYDWPGNIREMETLAARLAATAPEDRVDIADIPPEMLAEGERPPVLPEDAAELRDMERQQVLNALERHGWVQSRAARELGLTLRQIGYRIRKYGLNRDEDDAPEA